MRSNRGIFWYSLGLTLLLLLPMVLTVAFFTDQYQKQQLLRQASAADSALHIEPGAQGVYTLLLVVQQEEPAFVLARADGPQQTVTLCALPGSLRVSAPSGTTTLAECALSAGAGRAAQLLVGTVATGETAAPALHYIAATPATWADCAGRTASARIDTASLLDAAARTRLGYGEDPIAVCTAAQASELIAQLQAALPGAGEGCMARAAVWAAQRTDARILSGKRVAKGAGIVGAAIVHQQQLQPGGGIGQCACCGAAQRGCGPVAGNDDRNVAYAHGCSSCRIVL